MSKCTKCGVDVQEGNSFCSKCGTKVEKKTPPQPQSQPKPQTQPQPSGTVPAASQTPAVPQPASAPKKKSTGVKILLGCLGAFIVFVIVGGIVGYFLVKKGVEKAQDEIEKAEEGWKEGMEGFKEFENMGEEFKEEMEKEAESLKDDTDEDYDNSPGTETKKDKPTKKVSKVVEEFMACTLGTISNSCPTENKDKTAKEHLTLEMRADYNSDGFVPLTYCIQQGPDNVKIFSETETSGFAYVTISAQYGTDDYFPMWMFTLITQDGEWKIKEIQCLNYDIQ